MRLPSVKRDISSDVRDSERRRDVIDYLTQLLRELAQIASAANAVAVVDLVEKAYYEAGLLNLRLQAELQAQDEVQK